MSPVGPAYGFGLYVHWPYCARICPYCDFNVYTAANRDTDALTAALCADIRAHRSRLPGHPQLNSIFLGGGTPSLMSSQQIAVVLETANDTFGLAEAAEITVEANPNDILRADLSGWASTGINRVSLGIQSLDDAALAFLGRDHDSDAARRAIDAVQTRFDNHSLDLIYARPDQTLTDWQAELAAVLALGAPHLSLYELTIEARTAFGKRAARGELVPLPDDAQADLYELTQDMCNAAGLPAYEVSNHARAPEFESVHNHIYWASGDWLGIGPGAHGRLTIEGQRLATEAARRPADYIAAHQPDEAPLSRDETAMELLAMGLRPARGFDIRRYDALAGTPLSRPRIADLQAEGFLTLTGSTLALTQRGRLLADHIAAQLVS